MKKILAIILSTALILSCFGAIAVSAVSNELTISASDAEGARGDTVTVTLNVENNPGFAALLINISGGDNFEIVSYENGGVMSQITTGKNVIWDDATNSTVTGTLLTVTIRIGNNAPLGDNTVNVRVIECYNNSGEEVVAAAESIKVTVKDGEPTDTGSGEVEETPIEKDTSAKEPDANKGSDSEDKNTSSDNGAAKKSGCGSVVFGNVALISVASLVGFAIKRKKD